MKQVVEVDGQGYFLGMAEADESPLEPGVWLLPYGCLDVPAPIYNRVTHRARWTGSEWAFSAALEPVAVPPAPTEAEIRALLMLAARDRRDQAIRDGRVSVGGALLYTDDTTQQRLTGVALAATRNPGLVVQWKCADGEFRTLTSAQVIAAAEAVLAFVQACYTREAELRADLAEAVNPLTVDINEGWPE